MQCDLNLHKQLELIAYRKQINRLSIYQNLDKLLTLQTHLIMVFQSFYQSF